MADYELETIGSVSVDKRMECDFAISADDFFTRFATQAGSLSPAAVEALREAIDSGKSVKIKKEQDELNRFFAEIQPLAGADPAAGAGGEGEAYSETADEADEAYEIDEMKGEEMDATGPGSSATVNIEEGTTYDADTGAAEGVIELEDGNREGKLIPLVIQEHLERNLSHEGDELDDQVQVGGVFKIVNPSTQDRIWDVDVRFINTANTDLAEAQVAVQELEADQEHAIEYAVKDVGKRHLEVREFISTLDKADLASYVLTLNEPHRVYFKISLKNTAEAAISAIELTKEIHGEFSDLEIVSPAVGEAEIVDNVLTWRIPALTGVPEEDEGESEGAGQGQETSDPRAAVLEFRASITIESIEEKVNSGPIAVSYVAGELLSGLDVDAFDAYTRNQFYLDTEEMDEEPDKFRCQLIFKNTSEFIVSLVNADVWAVGNEANKFVDIDPDDLPKLPAGALWRSNFWEYAVEEEGAEPMFAKKCEFFVVADQQFETLGRLTLADVLLAVGSLSGMPEYTVAEIPSYRESEFGVTHNVENTGGAPLNEVMLHETIPDKYIPPTADEIEVFINGEPIPVDDPELVQVIPAGELAKPEEEVVVPVKNLTDQGYDQLAPADEVILAFPVSSTDPATLGDIDPSQVKLFKNDVPITLGPDDVVVEPLGAAVPDEVVEAPLAVLADQYEAFDPEDDVVLTFPVRSLDPDDPAPSPDDVRVFLNDEELALPADAITVDPIETDEGPAYQVRVEIDDPASKGLDPTNPDNVLRATYPNTCGNPDDLARPAPEDVQLLVTGDEVPLDADTVTVGPETLPEEAPEGQQVQVTIRDPAAKGLADLDPADDLRVVYPNTAENPEDLTRPQPDQVDAWVNDAAVPLDSASVAIRPKEREAVPESVIQVRLRDMKDQPYGMLEPGDTLQIKYPIKADEPLPGEDYVPKVLYSGNTDPAGAPITDEPEPEAVTVPVVHVRKKIAKGKEVRALGEKGAYEIELFVTNNGEHPLDITIRDKVPDNFTYTDFSEEPEIVDLEGEDLLTWAYDEIEPGTSVAITYHIMGEGDYSASDAQFAL